MAGYGPMCSVLIILVLLCFCHTYAAIGGCLQDIPSVFPGRLKPPGLNSPSKLWWAKEITPDFHVCGRLTEKQIKYAADAGFKSIVSLFTYPTEDPGGNFGGEYQPVTVEEQEIVENVAGLQFVALLDPMDEWSSVEAVEKLTAVMPTLKLPALLRCDRGYTITFVTLLYLANQTRYNDNFQPRIHSKEFFEISHSMGLDFFQRIPLEIVAEVTGEPLVSVEDKTLPRPNYDPEDWLDYWFAYPVYYNWFSAGQIYKSHIQPLEEFGYKSVVNIRAGLTMNGKPSQEEVNLLNVQGLTGTYGDAHTSPRQSDERLRETRIDPRRPNTFISDTSKINYEQQNPQEFGDNIGYNEELEQQAFNNSGVNYYHLPLSESMSELDDYMTAYKDRLLEIGRWGPVLVHCSRGQRAAYIAVLMAALQHDLSLEWSLQRLKELGLGISAETQPDVYNVYVKYLNSGTRVEL